MEKLYYYVRQTDRLLEPGMENVMKMFLDSKMPHMELSKLQLTKADREWLKRKYFILNELHVPLVANTPPYNSLLKSSIKRIRWINGRRVYLMRELLRVRMISLKS